MKRDMKIQSEMKIYKNSIEFINFLYLHTNYMSVNIT